MWLFLNNLDVFGGVFVFRNKSNRCVSREANLSSTWFQYTCYPLVLQLELCVFPTTTSPSRLNFACKCVWKMSKSWKTCTLETGCHCYVWIIDCLSVREALTWICTACMFRGRLDSVPLRRATFPAGQVESGKEFSRNVTDCSTTCALMQGLKNDLRPQKRHWGDRI